MGDMEFISTNELVVPLGQVVSYMLFSTLCFFFRKYKLGLMISFSYVFTWGFLYNSASFIDMLGEPTIGLFVYLASGFMMVFAALIGFFIQE